MKSGFLETLKEISILTLILLGVPFLMIGILVRFLIGNIQWEFERFKKKWGFKS